MSTPDRTIGGLPPRKPMDASRLIASNRPTQPIAPLLAPAAGESARVKVSVYLDVDLREAARSTYKATAHLEQDESWSDMVGKAIAAEIDRRQQAHNNGQPFAQVIGKLKPGRNIT